MDTPDSPTDKVSATPCTALCTALEALKRPEQRCTCAGRPTEVGPALTSTANDSPLSAGAALQLAAPTAAHLEHVVVEQRAALSDKFCNGIGYVGSWAVAGGTG